MQLLSLGAQYVITALILLGKRPVGEAVSAAELAKPLNSPATYLSQMLAKLIPSGIIASRRGLNGGVYLAKEPEKISLLEIVTAIEGDAFFNDCFLGIKGCGEIEPCPFHENWGCKRDRIHEWLRDTSLKSLCDDVTKDWIDERMKFHLKQES